MTNKKPQKPVAILLETGARAFLTRNTFYGDNAGVIARTGAEYHSVDAKHYSTEALKVFSNMETELDKLKRSLDKDSHDLIFKELQDLKAKVGTQSYGDAYKSFMSTLSDHVTVLTAFAPFIGTITSLLS